MKVSELIARLRELPADAEVHIAHPSGDYWRGRLRAERAALLARLAEIDAELGGAA